MFSTSRLCLHVDSNQSPHEILLWTLITAAAVTVRQRYMGECRVIVSFPWIFKVAAVIINCKCGPETDNESNLLVAHSEGLQPEQLHNSLKNTWETCSPVVFLEDQRLQTESAQFFLSTLMAKIRPSVSQTCSSGRS